MKKWAKKGGDGSKGRNEDGVKRRKRAENMTERQKEREGKR